MDLSNAIAHLKAVIRGAPSPSPSTSATAIITAYIEAAEEIFRKDLETNIAIGEHGSKWLLANAPAFSKTASSPSSPSSSSPLSPGDNKISVLTHCNTGSLATSGHGTALGVIRSLHAADQLQRAFCTETRPYNQGSRLTAFELAYEGIPGTLITDSMAGALFATRRDELRLAGVVVGADRVARNGDTANKIGTYALAVLARHHGLRFVVAAPTTSVDLLTESGEGIRIEERRAEELTQISGAVVGGDGVVDVGRSERVAIAHQGIDVWNPAFDVTPAELIDAVVTENGVVVKGEDGKFDFRDVMPERWAAVVGQ